MKIGICGGTFDPFHRGHLDPVLAVRNVMGWDRVLYVPAQRQPFKLALQSASPFHRFAMAVLATESVAGVYVVPWEVERDVVSFTVDTLEHLRSAYPEATLDWIIGDDNLDALAAWKSLDRIFEIANFAVLTRGVGHLPEQFRVRVSDAEKRSPHGLIVFAENATVPISSTEIRRRIRAGESIDAFVHPRVSRYIEHYGLYKGNA
jgi:nicotinate-nucleotide adenylyltransferase